MTIIPVVATLTEVIEVDVDGVVHTEGAGVVLSKDAIARIQIDPVTIRMDLTDITVKIPLNALKRLIDGTDRTVLGFECLETTNDNVGDAYAKAYDRMSDDDKARAESGRIVVVTTGSSTKTDKLGEVTITVPFSIESMDKNKLNNYFLNGDGVDDMGNVTYKDGYVTLTTDHFSSFLICEKLSDPPTPSSESSSVLIIAVVVAVVIIAILLAIYLIYTYRPDLIHRS